MTIARCKTEVNIQKNELFYSMNTWNLKLKTMQFTLPAKMKYLGVHIAIVIYVEDLYEENYNNLMKGIEEDLCKWRDIPSWREFHIHTENSVLPKY